MVGGVRRLEPGNCDEGEQQKLGKFDEIWKFKIKSRKLLISRNSRTFESSFEIQESFENCPKFKEVFFVKN
jgi:hypothetical protein